MSLNPRSLPDCSRLLSSYELTAHLRNAKLLALSADNRADTCRSEKGADAQQELKGLRDEASRHRELLWSVRPGDRVWLTLGSPPHPECEFGDVLGRGPSRESRPLVSRVPMDEHGCDRAHVAHDFVFDS